MVNQIASVTFMHVLQGKFTTIDLSRLSLISLLVTNDWLDDFRSGDSSYLVDSIAPVAQQSLPGLTPKVAEK